MILAVDWGGSSRRAFLLDDSFSLIRKAVDDRGVFALDAPFGESMTALRSSLGCPSNVRAVLSGMVGSRSGWLEVPYLSAPLSLWELPRSCAELPGEHCRIVPGVGYAEGPDVMRGEETQILGALLLEGELRDGSGIFLLPGTHSKWVTVVEGRIVSFTTYLTGELFAMLRSRGSLSAVLVSASADGPSFEDGLRAAAEGRALSAALFSLRAAVLLEKVEEADALAFLSGLLIGAEWVDRRREGEYLGEIRIVGEPSLARLHERAAAFFSRAARTIDPDEAYLAAVRHIGASS